MTPSCSSAIRVNGDVSVLPASCSLADAAIPVLRSTVTAVIKDRMLHIQAGAGVVADSIPELEWKETMNKGRAVFRAVAMAEAGIGRHSCDLGPEEA